MDVDDLFAESGGWGPYQLRNYALLAFPILFSSYQTVAYIFTTGNPTYRCQVPECEDERTKYFQPWLSRAIPLTESGLPDECHRYQPVQNFTKMCSSAAFDKEKTIRCDRWVFRDNENTVVSEFKILCSENAWKLALVGTTNYLGFFTGMPVSGIFADRYGRRKVLAISCFAQSVAGLLRSFAPNYETYLVLQFLGAFLSGAYNAGFVLGLEIVGPEKRVLGNAIICCFHSVGESVVGLLMWFLKDWRWLTRFLFIPGLFSLIYLWIVPESIRWLIAKGRTEETLAIFNEMARMNKKKLPPSAVNNNVMTMHIIEMTKGQGQKEENIKEASNQSKPDLQVQIKSSASLTELVKSSRLMIRLAICTICWMVITMVFFGLSLSSVSVDGNKYINFILSVIVELPGYMCTWLLMDYIKIGRRMSLSVSFLLTGFTCICFHFISGVPAAKLILFLMGKFSVTFSFAVVYIYTAEMFPTEVRNSLLGVCSMSGHIGSMLAPQTMLLVKYIDPIALWGMFSLVAGIFCLLFPETLNTRLPDTVAEAEKIGT